MSGKTRILSLGLVAVLIVLAGIILVLNADPPSKTVVEVKARFISGYTLDVKDPSGISLPNKIANDDPAAYYENVGNNIIELGDSLSLVIVTDRKSPRYVNLYFDSVVSGPGQDLPSSCTKPYFIYPEIIAPIGTTKLRMTAGGEWEMIPDPNDPDGIPTLRPKEDSALSFATMTDGQEAYVYTLFFYFNVPDLTSTKKVNESRMDYWFADCLWAKVRAWDWDGEKVNTWTFTPVTEPFKHKAWDGSDTWCHHPEGAIPYMVFSNASLSCDHGTYRMPWELEITRR